MCRLLAYSGRPVFMDSLLIEPGASLISQSKAAREAKTVINGDGCGIGWYGERVEPGTYHGVLPAWSDANLASLCRQLRVGLFMAHVRSATTGEVARANCHPFSVGRHLFAHNGQIDDYCSVRRRIDNLIPDAFFPLRRGTSDSEAIFLAALGRGLADDPVGAVESTLADVTAIAADGPGAGCVRFTSLYSDGDTLWAYHWASDDRAPSLYWRKLEDGIVVASEPFDGVTSAWTPVPPSCVMSFGREGEVRTMALSVGAADTRRAA